MTRDDDKADACRPNVVGYSRRVDAEKLRQDEDDPSEVTPSRDPGVTPVEIMAADRNGPHGDPPEDAVQAVVPALR